MSIFRLIAAYLFLVMLVEVFFYTLGFTLQKEIRVYLKITGTVF